jgi:hypothetical protein
LDRPDRAFDSAKRLKPSRSSHSFQVELKVALGMCKCASSRLAFGGGGLFVDRCPLRERERERAAARELVGVPAAHIEE